MDLKFILLLLVNKIKLAQLIENDAPYQQILQQSKLLDEYLIQAMIYINKDRI